MTIRPDARDACIIPTEPTNEAGRSDCEMPAHGNASHRARMRTAKLPDLSKVVMVNRAVTESGTLEESASHSVNWLPVHVLEGDRLHFTQESPARRVHFYDGHAPEELSSTYCYDEESNWTTYERRSSRLDWTADDYIAARDGYVRVEFDAACSDDSHLGDFATLMRARPRMLETPGSFARERERVIEQVRSLREPGDAVLVLVSDIHHAVGDSWEGALDNLTCVCEAIGPDAIMQLGDLTDGITPLSVTLQLASEVLEGLRGIGVPVLGCVGNHDANYFRGNADFMDATSCARFYLGSEQPSYVHDLPWRKLRLVFLHSFEPQREERYGFDEQDVRWLRHALRQTPKGWQALVCSHVPPLAKIHVWSDTILNGDAVMEALASFDQRRKGGVLAYLHGHNHADQVIWDYRFPIVGIGCEKYEFFQEKKPKGSVTPARMRNDASQELWDVLVAKPRTHRLEFVRFGAGESRSL